MPRLNDQELNRYKSGVFTDLTVQELAALITATKNVANGISAGLPVTITVGDHSVVLKGKRPQSAAAPNQPAHQDELVFAISSFAEGAADALIARALADQSKPD